ncbi:MAG TPA: gamma-glutamyltransferase [Bryobacteraceae bacterium]|nr:gamma-glutamyltransferase [Bryobacteraceae bacterium]
MRYLILLLAMLPAAAQERNYARSMVISDRGIVATSQTLASQAGAQILARGGSAIDAAIAANAALGVVEPMMCGIGGDLFAIYWDAKTGKLTGINASGWAPQGLTIDFLKSQGDKSMPQRGIQSVTVPGAVDGWAKLHERFGKLSWTELFQPAIYYAEHGYPLTELIQADWSGTTGKLKADENARRVFLHNDDAPKVGELFRDPQMAAAYRLIATGGRDAFYKGPIAKAILKTSDRLGGKMTAADLSEYGAEWVQPISTEYRGWRVYEMPPSSQGIAALEMLNIFAQFAMRNYFTRSTDELHIQIEAQKLAYADLHRYVADPRFAKVPVDGILSLSYARERARQIDPAKAKCDVAPGNPLPAAGDTIYLSVVDREGNIVSLIESLYSSFGSGVVVDDYGFALHNRGGLFTLDAQHPNALAPRKRPFHTIIPAFMEKGNLHIGFGIMGGLNQAQAHAQFVSNIVDQDMNIQAAMEAPRFTKLTAGGCNLSIENRVQPDVLDELRGRGHVLRVIGDYSQTVGGGQAVMHDSSAHINYGASDPRKDGAALPEPHPYFTAPASPPRR